MPLGTPYRPPAGRLCVCQGGHYGALAPPIDYVGGTYHDIEPDDALDVDSPANSRKRRYSRPDESSQRSGLACRRLGLRQRPEPLTRLPTVSSPVNLPPPGLRRRCPVLHDNRIVGALIRRLCHRRIMCTTSTDFLGPNFREWKGGRWRFARGPLNFVAGRINRDPCDPGGDSKRWVAANAKACIQSHAQTSLPTAKITTHAMRNRKIETAMSLCFLNSLNPSLSRVGRRKKIERMKRKIGIAAATKAMILKIIVHSF
jgi:hypothetical protein